MIENRFLAGVLIGLPISALCLMYTFVRRDYVLAALRAGEAEGGLSDRTLFWLMMCGPAIIGPLLGLVAAALYGWISPSLYVKVALGMGALMTIGAVVGRTPMALEKIVLNLLVVGGFGWLLPRLAGG